MLFEVERGYMKKLFLAVMFLGTFVLPSKAQNIRFDDVANQVILTNGIVTGIKPVASAVITVCTATGSGTPCTPLATNLVCSSSSDLVCNQPTIFNADSQGNYGSWMKPGRYKVSITGSGITGYLKNYDLPIGLYDAGSPSLVNPSITGGATITGGLTSDTVRASNLTPGNCVQGGTLGQLVPSSGPCGTSSGTLTATGTPANGNLAKFSGGTSLTNGDLSGDCTTSGALALICLKTNGISFAASAITDTTNATNISSGTLSSLRTPQINLAASGNGGVGGNLPTGNLNGGISAGPTTYWRGDGSWAPINSGANAVFVGTCFGTATSSTVINLYSLGNTGTLNCSNSGSTQGPRMPSPGTLQNLFVVATTGGVNGSSGVFTVAKNGSLTAVTCTLGTGTTCSDTVHSVAVVAGDRITVQFSTQGGETLATIQATLEKGP